MTSAVRPCDDRLERALQPRLGVGVDARGRLVEDEQRRVAVDGAREGQELPLAGAEVLPALVDARVEARPGAAPVASLEELERADAPERLLGPRAVGRLVADRDVDETVPGKRKTSCGTTEKASRSSLRLVAAHVLPEDADGPALRLVEAEEQARDRRLARARRADERDPLALARA